MQIGEGGHAGICNPRRNFIIYVYTLVVISTSLFDLWLLFNINMNSCASSQNLRMSDWENRPTNARCPGKKYVNSALWYSRITQINRRSMLHVGDLKHEVHM